MKRLVLFLVSLLVGLTTHAQFVPNGSFESWHLANNHEEPDYWATNNDSSFVGVKKDTAHFNGKYSLRVEQNGRASCKIAPWFWWIFQWMSKSNIVGNDTVAIKFSWYDKASKVLGEKTCFVTQSYSTFTYSFFNISGAPDSAVVTIIGGRNPGTTLTVDAFNLTGESVPNIADRIHARVSPNPVTHMAKLEFENPQHTYYHFSLFDVDGNTVFKDIRLNGGELNIERDGLPAGSYIWQLMAERTKEKASGQLVLE